MRHATWPKVWKSRMRIIAMVIAFVGALSAALAIEIEPSPQMCAAIFRGTVLSDTERQSLTNRGPAAVLHEAKIEVIKTLKEDVPLGKEVTVYYVSNPWQVCPQTPDLRKGDSAVFHCTRVSTAGLEKVLFLPAANWAKAPSTPQTNSPSIRLPSKPNR